MITEEQISIHLIPIRYLHKIINIDHNCEVEFQSKDSKIECLIISLLVIHISLSLLGTLM